VTQKKIDIDVDKIVNFAKDFKPTEVLLDGTGEPTLCPQFLDLYQRLNSEGIGQIITICTNVKARPLEWWKKLLSLRNPAIQTKLIMSIHFAQNNFTDVKRLFDCVFGVQGIESHMTAVISNDNVHNIIQEFDKTMLYILRMIGFVWDSNLSSTDILLNMRLLGDRFMSAVGFKTPFNSRMTKQHHYGRNLTALYIDKDDQETFKVIQVDGNLNETCIGRL